jgi:hypothetical protein
MGRSWGADAGVTRLHQLLPHDYDSDRVIGARWLRSHTIAIFLTTLLNGSWKLTGEDCSPSKAIIRSGLKGNKSDWAWKRRMPPTGPKLCRFVKLPLLGPVALSTHPLTEPCLVQNELEWIRQRGRVSKARAKSFTVNNKALQSISDKIQQLETGKIVIPPGPRLGDYVLRVKDLSKAFDGRMLLRDLSFDLVR